MNCQKCNSELVKRRRMNDSVTGFSFDHFDCDRCNIMYNKDGKPIDKKGKEIEDEENIVIGSDDDDDSMGA